MPRRARAPERPAPAAPPAPAAGGIAAGRVADRLHSGAIHLLRSLRREDATSGLSGPRLSALSVVVFGGPLTLGALAAAEQVRPPTMTRIVAALEAEGHVARERDPRDARLTRIVPTPAGTALLREGRARRVDRFARELRRLARDDLDTLDRAAGLLEQVIDRLRRDGSRA